MVFSIDDKLYKSISNFCESNDLDFERFVEGSLRKALSEAKYGENLLDNIEKEMVEEKPTKGRSKVKIVKK